MTPMHRSILKNVNYVPLYYEILYLINDPNANDLSLNIASDSHRRFRRRKLHFTVGTHGMDVKLGICNS